MNSQQALSGSRVVRRAETSGSTSPGWWLVFKEEVAELWLGGRVLGLLILFSVLLSVMAFLLATNSELSLTPPDLTELVTLQAAITFGLFIGLVIAAESITGERERATLETLLLTPTSRRQIVVGKFLAALSAWPAAMVLTIPYMITLSQGDPVLGPALLWGALTGTILAIAFTGLGMLVSIWSDSNKVSLFVSLLIYLACLLPSQLPGQVQTVPALVAVQAVDPVEATNQFLQRTLTNTTPHVGTAEVGSAVDPGSGSTVWIYLAGMVAVTLLIIGLLFFVAAPRLGLHGEGASIIRSITKRMEASYE